jgi:ketosteroid isomerase-like protein
MESLIHELYAGLAALDGDRMAACYADDARFEDPVFGELRGERIGAMWRMLCSGLDEIDVTVSGVSADGDGGQAHWVALYEFAGRPVENRIDATFRFADGLIVDHRDEFSFHRWASQALGWPGTLAGWTPRMRRTVRRQVLARLDRA